MANEQLLKGGEFLLKETKVENTFIPEEFDEEQQMIVQTCEEFLESEVYPNLDRIDTQENGLMADLVGKAGELGLLGISVPEEYEGFNQNFLTNMRANEAMGAANSFSVAFMCHTGIGTLPILYYGNEEQKQKYVPQLASGELKAAYCLTEPGAGSDANSGTTKATLSEDGKHYILNGAKMWITNGGFADVQTVFAKIDNDRVLSAFIVEKDWDGVVINTEEKKMGIKGSSTVQIFYNNVKVPIENMLGKRGQGFRIALNILHIGRIKLGATVVGAAKRAITQSVNYANERNQFGKPISNFGAIRSKLGEQVIQAYVAESAVYKASKDVDDTIVAYTAEGMSHGEANIRGTAQFAIECALIKVLGSEALDYIVDESVQIFGGMGFSADAPADRAYRDSRINRIFEGTNEINRLLIVDTVLKRAMKGEIDLFNQAKIVVDKLNEEADHKFEIKSYYEERKENIQNFKDAVLMILGVASDKFKRKFVFEQEIWMNISDMIMLVYASEATFARVKKMEMIKEANEDSGYEELDMYKDILNVYMYDAAAKINKAGADAINSFADGKEQVLLLEALKKFTKVSPVNVKEARQKIASKLIDDNRYNF